ncbi:MAG: MMPL family transporter [Oscillospiraceae bacterium]|nr:MMPL family transporter [Oscillospiraceae bacterium]
MNKLAELLVRRRRLFAVITLVVTLICAAMALRVEINTDMSRYLPSKSAMRRGTELLQQAFPNDPEQSTFRFVFNGLDESEIPEIQRTIEEHVYVSRVEYVSGDARYNRDGRTLFVVSVDDGYDSHPARNVQAHFADVFSDYDFTIGTNEPQKTEVPLTLLAIGVTIVVIILVIMSQSWIEPVLFLIAIGMAVVINFGSNLMFGYISDLTMAIGPVLQLVLSMDYSIILMNRYRDYRREGQPKRQAMTAALEHSFSSILSSSLTTVVGLLALAFMTYKIGRELGFVLAKGVFISMVCVFFVLPTLILWADELIFKTAKKTLPLPTGWLAVFSEKARRVIPIVFVVMFAAFFFLRQFTPIIFTENLTDDLTPYFPADNTVVLLYENTDEDAVLPLIAELEQDERVRAVQAYANTLGVPMTREQMTETMSQGEENPATAQLVGLIYDAYSPDPDATLSLDQFTELFTRNADLAAFFGDEAPLVFSMMRGEIETQKAQMIGEHWSRVVIQTTYPEDSDETTAFLDTLYARCEQDFSGETYLIGTSAMVHEMEANFSREYLTVTLITAAAIFLVVLLTFRSPVIPLLLVLLVQCGVYITVTAMGWQGYDVYYLALLIVQGILMGATIDYAILFSNYYRELRRTTDRLGALRGAYANSIHTIMTSGLILIGVTAILGVFCTTQSIAQVCTTIALGSTSAVVLILLILPGLLSAFDRLIAKKR